MSEVIYEVRPALVLDMDNTVRRSAKGHNFIHGSEDVELFPDVEEVLDKYRHDFWIVGATNQGGVAFGIKSPEMCAEENTRTCALFKDNPFIMIAVALAHPNGRKPPYNRHSLFRKPHYGMLVTIEQVLVAQGKIVDWPHSLLVGDRVEDQECAHRAEINFAWTHDFFGRTLDLPQKQEQE